MILGYYVEYEIPNYLGDCGSRLLNFFGYSGCLREKRGLRQSQLWRDEREERKGM